MAYVNSLRNEVILSSPAHGRFIEGLLAGTPKPGTCMTIVGATALVAGKFTWDPWSRADGANGLIAILLPDDLLGGVIGTAFVTGARIKMYCPLPGDELQVLFGNASGTADDVAVGGLLIVDGTTGKVIPTPGSPEREPFEALEAIVDPSADQLLAVMYTGS